MLNWIKFFVLTTTFLFVSFGFGQVIFTEDFESGSGGFTTSSSQCTDNDYDYFTVSDGSNISATYNSSTGSYFATQDIDACTGGTPETITWSGISISGCSSLNFSIDLADDQNGWPSQGWDGNDYVHISYSIDGGALQELIWIESSDASASVETQAFIDTDFDGIGDGAQITGDFSTFTNSISGTGSTIDIIIEFANAEGYVDLAIDNLILTGSCAPPPPNTITTGTVSPLTYNVDCTTGEAGTVGFTSTEVYNGGNVFTAELSDATGSFAAPTSIGTLAASGTDPSGTINITIPAGTASGTGYRIRVVSSDPVVTGTDNGANITINLTGGPCVTIPPHLTSVIINSCNASCQEGQNELVFGNTGDYSILVNEANFNFSYTNLSSLNNYTDNLTNNASTTQDINDECPSTDPFIDAYGTTIPPNSSWVLANDAICPTDALDWSGLCNSGPIYIIYSTDTDWLVGGNFSNDPPTATPLRPYQTSVTTTSGDTFTINYETDGSLYPDNDGVFATFDYNGGSATSYGDDDCSFNVSVLPIELNTFKGTYNGSSSILSWQTLSEQNNDYFALYHSTNGKTFDRIGKVPGSGNTSTLLDYSFKHRTPHPGINYYKLKSVDYDGTVHDKGIIAVQVEMNHVFYDQITQSIQMNYSSDYAVYGSDGRLITRVANQNAIPFSGHGVFHVIDERSGKAFKLGIW